MTSDALATQTESPSADALDPAAPPTAEALAPSIEAALLSLERPAGHERLAVALGLVEPEPEDAPSPSAAEPETVLPSGPVVESNAETSPDPLADARGSSNPAPKRRTTRATAAAKARREALSAASALIDAAIAHLNDSYAATGRSFRIEQVSGGFRMMTLPAHAAVVAAIHANRVQTRLSKSAVEALAIIAYKQPITRAQLEAIRGVACGEVLRSLMDRRLVTIKGRSEELGRPILYATSKQFLDHFGLASITDLPTLTELKPI
jgi:segregation and condensation protein B